MQFCTLFFLAVLAAEGPAAQHGEIVEGGGAVLLYRHSGGYCHPAGWLVAGNADRFVGIDACKSAHVLHIRLRVVLAGRRPFADDSADGV